MAGEIDIKYLLGEPAVMRAASGGHSYRLLSYLSLRDNKNAKELLDTAVEAYGHPENVIIDSGAFSVMFGAKKGMLPETLDAYSEFTDEYLENIERWGFKGIIIEMDVHRLLGMEDLLKLRARFKSFGKRVMYVWHEPEGLDGMGALAREKDFVAFSLIELNVISGSGNVMSGNAKITNGMAMDLLRRVHEADPKRKPPRIHMLGCMQAPLIESRLPWSADASSWLAGVRYGTGLIFDPQKGVHGVHLRSNKFQRWQRMAMSTMPEYEAWAEGKKNPEYWKVIAASGYAFAQYQEFMDARFSHIKTRNEVSP